MPHRPAAVVLTSAALAGTLLASPTAVADPPRHRAPTTLPLGAVDLPETRTTTTLQPGVTLTRITRGVPDTTDTWTVEVASPDADSPDPDAPAVAITSRSEARRTAAALSGAGLTPRVEAVRTPRTVDLAGLLGYRVRVGAFGTKQDAAQTLSTVTSAGLTGTAVYTGWDADAGAEPSRGPWHLQVITVDPQRFTGRLRGDHGPDFVNRETTSALARAAGATAAVNAGFFVLDPAAGAPGDPAGVAVYRGRIESETTGGRPALVVHDDGRRTRIVRLWWHGRLRTGVGSMPLTGLNRVPGKIRNCGVTGGQPTPRPLQDVTCTRSSDLVAFDAAYGRTTPADVDAEVVLDRRDRVVTVDESGGAVIPEHGRVVAAIGAAAPRLLALARRTQRMHVGSALRTADGHRLALDRATTVLNGAPQLVRGGRVWVTPRRDGAIHPGEPSFYYGWGHKRNPRTFAGVDARGRLLLVTADGRSTESLGLGLAETARVARALGMRRAMNLDGGGSTTAVVRGTVVNQPSDSTGERPVGDVLEVLPPLG